MTASGKRFIIYLSAEIGTEAEVGQAQLLSLLARERLECEGCNRSSAASHVSG